MCVPSQQVYGQIPPRQEEVLGLTAELPLLFAPPPPRLQIREAARPARVAVENWEPRSHGPILTMGSWELDCSLNVIIPKETSCQQGCDPGQCVYEHGHGFSRHSAAALHLSGHQPTSKEGAPACEGQDFGLPWQPRTPSAPCGASQGLCSKALSPVTALPQLLGKRRASARQVGSRALSFQPPPLAVCTGKHVCRCVNSVNNLGSRSSR